MKLAFLQTNYIKECVAAITESALEVLSSCLRPILLPRVSLRALC